MTVTRGNDGSAREGLRRDRRIARKKAENLVLRHRWYAGGVATLISAALVFTGVATPAMADTVPPSTDTTAATTTDAPADPAATVPAVTDPAPADPATTTDPAPADPAAPESTEPAPSGTTDEPATTDETTTDETTTDEATTDEPATTDEQTTQAPAARVAEQQVVVDAPGTATLRVKKLAQRMSGGGVTVLGGATFYAIAGTRNTPPANLDVTSPYTCTTSGIGICEITVPSLTGGTGGSTAGYWIVEAAAPAGWNRITSIGTGQHTGAKTPSLYTFFTGNVTTGAYVRVTDDTTSYANPFTGSTTKTTEEGGVVNVRSNPVFPETCGVSIALVFDTSNSINSTKMAQMKAAANDFVSTNGLGGTASSVSIYAFGTIAGQLLTSTSILDSAGQDTVSNVINNVLPSDGAGYTNWDDAFRKVAFNGSETYDVVLFLTDGDPTTYGTTGSDIETNVDFRNVEEGALSANAVKSQVGPAGNNTKVVGVGIGLQANSYLNLQAISGPTENEDYYRTDFTGLAEKLHEIATKNCGGSLTVIKKTVDAEGKVIDSSANGWTFTGSTDGDYIVGPGGLTDSLSLTTGAITDGSVNYDIDFSDASPSRAVGVKEQQQAGFTPDSVSCTGAEPTGGAGNFTVDVPIDGIVSCTVVNKQVLVPLDDVSITKTATGIPEVGSVEPGDSFDYVLTVTNNGTRPAEGVHVTDSDLNDRLEITGLTVDPALTWGPAPGYVGNVVDLTIDELGVGESATITVSVTFLAPEPILNDGQIPQVIGDAPAPAAPLPLETLTNTACVETALDPIDGPNGENNCATYEIPVRDISAVLYTRCVADAPLLGWTISKSATLTAEPIDFLWTPINGSPTTTPANVALSQPGGTTSWSDEIQWPGSAFTPSGISIDYPGWRPLAAADYAPDGGYYLPGTTDVMTPDQEAEFVFNGLILDPSELDYAWRLDSQVTFSVNPELTYTVAYPEATPDCFVARHADVQIEKTASVEKAQPGDSFTYTIDASNVSDDSAADGVVITDAIPSDLKITNVTWTGKSDAATFPNWESCAVTGQNASGYGGTLSCTLFGPLQPAGAGLGTSSAPTITLAATVNPASTASVLTNVAVVDYYTFGDPSDAGRDSDDAVVLLAGLPATGGSPATSLILLGLFGVVAGVATMLVIRRRRGDAKPQL